MFLHSHADDVGDPDDVPAKNKSQKSRHDFAFHKSCHKAQNPRSHGYDRQNKADHIAKTKVIVFAFCCHNIPHRKCIFGFILQIVYYHNHEKM